MSHCSDFCTLCACVFVFFPEDFYYYFYYYVQDTVKLLMFVLGVQSCSLIQQHKAIDCIFSLCDTPGHKKFSYKCQLILQENYKLSLAHLSQDVRYLYPEQRDGNLMLACFRELVLVNQRTFP